MAVGRCIGYCGVHVCLYSGTNTLFLESRYDVEYRSVWGRHTQRAPDSWDYHRYIELVLAFGITTIMTLNFN
jgi:hypothetical protein